MLSFHKATILLSFSLIGCARPVTQPPGAELIRLLGTPTQDSHPYLHGEMVPDRVLLNEYNHAQFWSQLSNGRPTRVIEMFYAIPNTMNSHNSELQWLSPAEWDRLAVALHAQWRTTLSTRPDIQFVEISEIPALSDAVQEDNCMDLAGPFSMETIYRIRKEGDCQRTVPLSVEQAELAHNADWVDGLLAVEVLIRRCPLQGETKWWTGASLNLRVALHGDNVSEGESGPFKGFGFFDEPPQWLPVEGCTPLPLTTSGRRVDPSKLAELLSAELHRRVSANLAVLPRMDQPWPTPGTEHPP